MATTQVWDAYLESLEGLVGILEQTLAEGGLPVWHAPEVPALPAPPQTLARRDQLLVRMMVAAQQIERRMDGVRDELEALPSRRPRAAVAYAGTIGGQFDYRG